MKGFVRLLAGAAIAGALLAAQAWEGEEDCFTDTCVGCTDDCLDPPPTTDGCDEACQIAELAAEYPVKPLTGESLEEYQERIRNWERDE